MKPKRILSILLSLCMLMTLLPVTALAAESLDAIKTDPGETYTYQDDDGNSHSQTVNTTFDFVVDNVAYRYLNGADGDEVAVAEWSWSYSCINCGMGDKHMNVLHHSFYSGTVNVPSSVWCDDKPYNVTAVDNNAFASFTGTVTLSEGIKTIGRDSFYNYHPSGNAVFTVPSSVTEIGEGCFERTTATVQFAEDSELKTVGATAFAQLTQSTLVLPDGLETLGDRVFENSNNTAVTIPGTVTNLSPSVLSGYTGTLSFTDGPANFKITDDVLYGWGKLIQVRDKTVTSITIPEGITEIGPLAFANMSTLKTVNLPFTLTTLGYGAFSKSGIESIVIPANVSSMVEAPSSNTYNGLFAYCTSLQSVEIKGNWDAIPDYAFYNCTALETVQFPASVTAVGKQAFQGCSDLQTVDLSNIETIGEQAFRQSGISDVVSLNRLQSMGRTAFLKCTNLTSMILPEGITSIELSTFNGCTGLDLLVLPSTITSIENFALALGSSSNCNLVMKSVALSDVAENAFGSSGKPDSLTVYYPAEAQEAYETAGLIDEGDTNGYALSLTDSSMALASGENSSTLTLNATVPTGMTLVTTSSNPAVATAEGSTITGVTEGTATITAQLKVGEYVVLEDSCTVTVTAEGAVIPTVEEPETSVSDSITEEEDKTTATNVAGSVAADETITSAAQSAANSLNNSSDKDTLIEKGKTELSPPADQEVTLYTQTYLNIEATDLTKDESTVTSITLNITPMMQVVASTATNSADVELGETGKNAVVVKEAAPLTIRNASEITVTLPSNFASQTVYVKHQASNGGTYFYQATADSTGKVTFTSTHGFSPFTFSLTNEAVAVVDGIGYASFQEAVNAAADGATVEVLKNENLTATVSGSSRTITVKNSTGSSITVTLNGQAMTIASGSTQDYTYTRPSGGGGSSVTTYAISTPSKVNNGTIKVSPTRASKGTTVTITVTPDEGYELAKLTVTDKNDDTVKLTDKGNGKYTFTMPASAVEVEVSFQEIVIEPDNPFTDVSTSDYYYDAVLWAVKNGVTNGTSATTFGPNMAVSRAQMVTFLWRAHGSPKATGTNPFTDVSTSDYYYDAVLWAVANGVTNGTSATTFSPDMAVTRAQAVTFQWRAAGSPVVSGSSFGDVATDAYYVNAVTWAVANGITNGTGGNTFSPDVVVSRAQAVTFLYREQE